MMPLLSAVSPSLPARPSVLAWRAKARGGVGRLSSPPVKPFARQTVLPVEPYRDRQGPHGRTGRLTENKVFSVPNLSDQDTTGWAKPNHIDLFLEHFLEKYESCSRKLFSYDHIPKLLNRRLGYHFLTSNNSSFLAKSNSDKTLLAIFSPRSIEFSGAEFSIGGVRKSVATFCK